jgi:glutamate synthase (NADPH/NADH) small chain
VSIIYRRSRDEMPSRAEEIRHGEEEGLRFDFLKAPVNIIGNENGLVSAIQLIDMRLTEPDASGRRRPVPVEGSEQHWEVDTVIVAIGQRPNPMIASTTPGLEVDKRGYLVVDEETMATTREGVYAGGDIVGWGASVIRAMGDGRKAAKALHDYLTLTP